MATVPNPKLLEDARIPRIAIDGVEWPVPKLAIAQNVVIVPLIPKIMPALPSKEQPDIDRLTQEILGDMTGMAFEALRRGHPDLTRAEFDQMPLGIAELVDAMNVIALQTGLVRQTKPGERSVSDPLAAAATAPPTG